MKLLFNSAKNHHFSELLNTFSFSALLHFGTVELPPPKALKKPCFGHILSNFLKKHAKKSVFNYFWSFEKKIAFFWRASPSKISALPEPLIEKLLGQAAKIGGFKKSTKGGGSGGRPKSPTASNHMANQKIRKNKALFHFPTTSKIFLTQITVHIVQLSWKLTCRLIRPWQTYLIFIINLVKPHLRP